MKDFLEQASCRYGFAYGVCRTALTADRLQHMGDDYARRALAPAEYADYLTLKLQKRRIEWLSGRLAAKITATKLCRMLGKNNSWNDLIILSDDARAPYLAEQPQWTLSISHSGEFAVAVMSERRIGVDLEKIVDHPSALADYFCCEEEQAELAHWQPEPSVWNRLLMQFWTRKEAVAKFAKLGGRMNFRAINTLAEPLHIGDGLDARWLSNADDAYCLSLALPID